VTYEYTLIAQDGTSSKTVDREFNLPAGPARPPMITMIGGPSSTRVGQPFQIYINVESPDADVVKIQERTLDANGAASAPNIVTVEPRRSGPIPFSWAASQVPLRVTAEFVLIDANGNRSEPRQRTFEVLGTPAVAQADRTRPAPVNSRAAYANNSGCSGCGTIVNVRALAQAGNSVNAGAAVGGLLGGLVDSTHRNQSGGAGAAAGALAGALIGGQQQVGSTPVYEVMVRYDDGRTQTIRSGFGGWHNGDRVQYANGSLRYAP